MARFRLPLVALTLLVLMGISRPAAAQPLELQHEWFGADTTAPEFANGPDSYWFFGYQNGDTYSFSVDFFLDTTSITDSTLYVAHYGDGSIWDYDYSGAVEGDGDVTMLNAGVTLPSNATGILYVEFTIYFADGSQLNDFRFVELD